MECAMDSKNEEKKLIESLFKAIEENELAEVRRLVLLGANLAFQNENKRTPIHQAAALSHWKCVKAIAECANTDVADTFQFGTALLFVASKLDTHDIAQELLLSGAPITKTCDGENNTCLHYAVMKKNTPLLELLLKKQADVTKTNKNGRTPLDLSCSYGHWCCTQILMEDVSFKKFSYQKKEVGGQSFIAAIKGDKLDIARELLRVGASATEMTKSDKNTALHWVSKKWTSFSNKIQMLQFVLANGGNLTAVNQNGKTPIESASGLGYWECVQSMLGFERKKNPKMSEERIQALHLEKVLIHAIKQADHTYTQLLLEMGVSGNSFNNEMGTISLYWAVKNNQDKILQLLLTHKVNTTRLTKTGQSILDLAKELNHITCIELLEKKDVFKPNFPQPTSTKGNMIEATRSYVTKLFDSLCDKDIPTGKIPNTIDDFIKSYQKILEHDKTYFQEERAKLRKQTFQQAPFLTSVTDTNTQAGSISILLQFINGLLETQQSIPPLNYPLGIHIVEERDIHYYLECMKVIEYYRDRVHIFLLVNLKTKIENIIKNTDFWDTLVCPIPDPIQNISLILNREELSKSPSMGYILKTYLEVIAQFEYKSALKAGDKRVQDLCGWAYQSIKSLTFLPENIVNENVSYPTQSFQNTIYTPNITNAQTTMYQPPYMQQQLVNPNAQMYPYMTNIEAPQIQHVPVLEPVNPALFQPLNQYSFLSTSVRNQDTLSDNATLNSLLGLQ